MINKQRLINTFLELVQINSESGNEQNIQSHLKQQFQNLGLIVKEDFASEQEGLGANNLVCTLPASVNFEKADKIYFTSHMDTVVPGIDVKPQIKNDGYIYSDGTTILGADDKAGLASIFELIRTLNEQNMPHGQIQFVITVGEEIGLEGAKALDSNLLDAQFGYAVDASVDVGTTVTHAPTQMKVNATIYGKKAHASTPNKGVSAINIAAKAVSEMKLGQIDQYTTANIGRFEGGSATNIVADEVTLLAEARSHSDDSIKAQVEHMKSVFEQTASKYGCTASVEIIKSYPGFKIPDDAPVTKIAKASAVALGLKPHTVMAGGGSDGNIINQLGIPTVILGVGYENIHTTEERMPIESLHKLAEQLVKIVEIITQQSEN
ncbi:M20/M25/M40 family metallo-hydrolase [Staphylococcus caeli]|uniref:M20/M25/M40 family metallo-hydrolase n=1 Tax=Staphylococcus caeli TaxID=2201815 RepID=UPI003F56CBE1